MNDVTGRSGAGSVLLTAAAFVVIVAGMRAAEAIVVPFLLSVFIAIISAPSLFWLERKGLPRWLAMLGVIGATIAAGIGVTVLVGTSIREFTRDIPEYTARLNAEVQPLWSGYARRARASRRAATCSTQRASRASSGPWPTIPTMHWTGSRTFGRR